MRRSALLLSLLTACSGAATSDVARTTTLTLTGAGATFPYPVYTRWFSRFGDSTGVRITYQSVGSGAGVRALLAGTVDFAATDVPLDTTEQRLLRALTIRQVPLVVGGAAVAYHLPALARQLRLDGSVLGDIFLGRITQWSDARIAALNPDIPLPAQQIRVITRADTSGTSWILTDYLSRVHPAWSSGPIRGNEGVASEIKVTPYSIGVVEAVYAMQNRLPVARIRNHAGAWVTPQTGALRSAASAMLASMDDTVEFATSISDAPGELSYPIASLSWLMIPTQGRDSTHLAAMRRFVSWALANGNADALVLGYSPLPDSMRATLQRAWPAPPR
jgi:phosphate transport system substrate-binding protein